MISGKCTKILRLTMWYMKCNPQTHSLVNHFCKEMLWTVQHSKNTTRNFYWISSCNYPICLYIHISPIKWCQPKSPASAAKSKWHKPFSPQLFKKPKKQPIIAFTTWVSLITRPNNLQTADSNHQGWAKELKHSCPRHWISTSWQQTSV